LDACEDWKVVRWCGTQASNHNLQGVVGGGVNETGMSTAAPNRSAVFCSRMDQGSGGCSQRCCSSTPARASKPLQECDAWCQLLAKWLKVSAIRERPVQRYSEVLGSEQKGRVSLLKLTFSSRLASLLLRWKADNAVFVVLSFSFQVCMYSPSVTMSLLSAPSTANQSPSACMIARSSA